MIKIIKTIELHLVLVDLLKKPIPCL